MDLNTILIIVGIVALLALIVHGLWSNRREKSKYFDEANKFEKVSPKAHHEQAVQTEEMSQHAPQHPHHAPTQVESQVVAPENIAEPVKEKSVDDIKISIPNYDMGHRAEPIKPVRAEYDMPMPSSPKNIGQMTIEEIKAQSQSDDFEGINSSSPELREQLAELAAQGGNLETSSLFNNISPEPVSKPKQTKGYIQLYLIPEHQEEFNGVKLVQALENLGFLFGDQDMYHRHLDLSVASPVLFSIANLQQPGTFDPYNLADFSTVGIVLFMHLPSPGNNLANLRMMIRAARTLAEDLQGIVLTEEQDIFDDKAEQDYLSRVA